MKAYQVLNNHGMGEGIVGVFSTVENAKKEIDKVYARGCGGKMLIEEIVLDHPEKGVVCIEVYVRDWKTNEKVPVNEDDWVE